MECRDRLPIAVTGFGIRFPGGVNTEQQFWQLIANGQDGIVDIPEDRWDPQRFYHSDPDMPGKMYVNKGGFLQDPIDEFDALYFGITPREAACMDPQQRLILQVIWEALHHAGIIPEQLAGSQTGVYIGAFTLDNLLQQMGPLARDLIGAHTAVGSTMTILSNRISYLLDLHGPSLSVDTACSSSLVALHHACQAIWSGDCPQALVGGVNVMFRPEYWIAMCKGKFLSRDGYCKSFDARADGYARGEGAGAVILKPLAEAERDGDIIHGVIRGTGVNQDGRSNGITSPNAASQVALIQAVHTQADVTPEQISYVEAHGTGTQAGDTAETKALGEALGSARTEPLPIGSVKANLGHLEAASGIAGLIKTLLCLKHQQIPPVANLQTANPEIPFAELGLHLPRQLEPMRKNQEFAYAALNSFGYGGTNAHVLLQQAPQTPTLTVAEQQHYILPVAAKDPAALIELAQRYRRDIEQRAELSLSNYCYSATVRRGHYQHRAAVVGNNRSELLQRLELLVQQQQRDGVVLGEVFGDAKRPVFVFTGMGPQWWAMGRELFNTDPVFKAEAERCDAAFQNISGWSILAEMLAAEADSKISSTTIAQPANFVLQAALAAMWQVRGIQPAAIIGHSVGEVTAAYVAGVLTLEEAARVSYYRSQIQNKAAGQGGMLAAGMSAADAQAVLKKYPDAKLDIAAVNSPQSVTLSGDTQVLQQIAADLDEQGVFQRALQVEVAYHSAYMDPLMAEMQQALADLNPQLPQVPLYSTVTGERVTDRQYSAAYWCRNARQAVLFAPALLAMLQDGYDLLLEVGPHPVLSTSIKQCAASVEKRIVSIATLNRKQPEAERVAIATAELYAAGCEPDWCAILPDNCQYIPLPNYPWQNTQHWLESEYSRQDRVFRPAHPLLGLQQNSPQPLWSTSLNSQAQPYLNDHCVEQLVVLPGAAYVELGLATHKTVHQQTQWAIEDLQFFNALIVADNDEPEIRTSYDPEQRRFAVHSKSRDTQQWQAHADGCLSLLPLPHTPSLPLETLLDSMQTRQSQAEHYASMQSRQLQYGPSFQGVVEIWQGSGCLLARVVMPDTVLAELEQYCLHPCLLDACFQSLLSVLPADDERAFVPTNIRQIRYYAQPKAEVYCYGSIGSITNDTLQGDLIICDGTGTVLVELIGVKARSLSQTEHLSSKELDDWLYAIDWERLEPLTIAQRGHWLLAGDWHDQHSLAARTQQALIEAGAELTLIEYGEHFEQIDARRFVVNPTAQEDFAALLQATAATQYAGLLIFPVSNDAAASTAITDSKILATVAVLQGFVRAQAQHVAQLCFVTQGAQPTEITYTEMCLNETGVIGLLRVAANEYPEYRFRSIDMDADTQPQTLAAEILSDSTEHELALRNNQRLAMRMLRRKAVDIQMAVDQQVKSSTSFSIDTQAATPVLRAADYHLQQANDVKLAVQAATTISNDLNHHIAGEDNYGLNTRLYLCSLLERSSDHGMLSGHHVLVLSQQALSSHRVVDQSQLLLLPNNQAITADNLGSVFALAIAHRLLVDVASLSATQSILIHAADTPIGMAAVKIARARGAIIYVSVHHPDSYQEPGVQQCFSSQTLDFSRQLLRITNDQGVDVVLNPYSGEIAEHSVELVKTRGCLINTSTDALRIKAGIRAHMLDINALLLEHIAEFRLAVDHVAEELAADRYTPIAEHRIAIEQLKTLSPEKLIGAGYTLQLQAPVSAELFKTAPLQIDANASYLVTGGFGGFGSLVVRHLVERGARNIIIVSRSGPNSESANALIADLTTIGVRIEAPQLDISNAEQVAELFATEVAAMPPLKGIVHTAGVLDDSPINFIAASNLHRVMGPKVHGAWNLHQQTLEKSLDFFVLFSSVSSMMGAAGQATYVIANTWLDSFAHYRQSLGLPAISISWGALGEVGMAAVDPEVVAYFERVGFVPISPVKAIAGYAQLVDWQLPHLGFVDVNWSAWGSYYPAWAKSARYAHLMPQTSGQNTEANDWLQAWLQESEAAQLELILQRLIPIIASSMKLPVDKITPSNNLPELGIDSLIAMELQAVVQQELGVRISTLELMKGNSLQQMAAYIRSQYLDSATANPESERIAEQAEAMALTDVADEKLLAGLDDAQLDALLAEMAEVN